MYAGPPPTQPMYGQPPPPRGRGPKILVLTTVLAVLLGGGAFAFYKADPLHLFTAGPQAAEALPSGALFYVGVDADPSAEQKIAALRFLDHFPAFRQNSGLTNANADIRATVFQKAIDSAGCTGVSYDDTVKPWLGEKFGLALMPGATQGDDPNAVIAVAISDEAKAKTGLSALSSCGDKTAGTTFGYAFEHGYVLLAETQGLADTYAKQASSSSLADNTSFTDDMDSIGDLGVATMWVDVHAVIDAYGDRAAGSGVTQDQLSSLASEYQRAAATFRFASDHVEIAASVFGNTPDISHHDNQIVDLPDSTVFAMSEAGGSERLKASWDTIKNTMTSDGLDVDQQISDFETRTGLTLPDDLETLLGDNILFSLDSNGLSAGSLQSGDASQLNAGVRLSGDPAKLSALYDKITSLIQDQTGQPLTLSKADSADGMSIATNDSYASSLAGMDGTLGDSAAFRSVIQDASSKEFVLFFDWDAIEPQVIAAIPDSTSAATQEVIDNLKALRAIGVSSETDGSYTVTTTEVSVDD